MKNTPYSNTKNPSDFTGVHWHSTWAGRLKLRVAGLFRRVKNGKENTVANSSDYAGDKTGLLAA